MSLFEFLALPVERRQAALQAAIEAQHRYHLERNTAYRRTLIARGVGQQIRSDELNRLLRPAALTFKGYADRVGLFPQDDARGFLAWLGEQVSIDLERERWTAFRRRYGSLEALLVAVEQVYADLGLEIFTSSGTSGRASVVVRDRAALGVAVDAFAVSIRRAWGITRGTSMVFVVPERTRVAMARFASMMTRVLDWGAESRVAYTVPYPASPDRLRIRSGRTFRPGVRGIVERRLRRPLMGWVYEHLASDKIASLTLAELRRCTEAGRPVMLLGGLAQLHEIALRGSVNLPPGSRVATGGGIKGDSPLSPRQIRQALVAAFPNVPVSDVYGMAEANWAAFECPAGNHHIPPWVYSLVTDDNDRIVPGPVATGLLAFFDPIGGGAVFPPFFQTADRVCLRNGGSETDPALACPCGDDGAHIVGGIERVDLMEEAGCAAQV